MVALSITERERICNALQEVGGVHSIYDIEDSTTSRERRDLTLCMSILGIGVFYSPERGYED